MEREKSSHCSTPSSTAAFPFLPHLSLLIPICSFCTNRSRGFTSLHGASRLLGAADMDNHFVQEIVTILHQVEFVKLTCEAFEKNFIKSIYFYANVTRP